MTRYFRYTLDDLKKSSDRKLFTYITFFAGGGGSSCGYKLAGGDCLFMNEFQQVAVDDYLANFPDTPHHICGDIKNVTGQQIMEMTGLKVSELDLLDGSPPCPPFSMSGTKQKGWGKEKSAYGMKQKNIEDLTWEQIRIAKDIQPKVIVCENVKGLTMEYAQVHLNRMVEDFEALGYSTTYKVLNGIHFGVPQKRQRVFIISIRNDVLDAIGMPWMLISTLFPEPVDEEPTIENAIGDLRLDNENSVEAVELCDAMKKSAKYKWLKRLPKNPDKVVSVGDDVVSPWYDKVIAHRKKMGKELPEKKKSFYQSRRVPWHQASHTLSEQGLQTSLAVHLHPEEDRVFTTKESARIMTLPDDYIFTGTLNQNLARIGLMVAPLCLKYLADNIYENILKPYKRSQA